MQVMPSSAGTFVLIHGAWHGGWCWDRLVASLETRGYRGIAIDLPAEDGSATFHDYARTVVEAIPEDANNVVLVAHSLGGMTVPLVAARRPLRAAVYLCGVVPKPGGSPWDDGPEMSAPGAFDGLVTNDDGSTSWTSFEAARDAFYDDCSPHDARWAFDRLRRQNSSSLWREPYPAANVAPLEQIYIAGTHDRAVTLPWARHVAATRLGVDLIELPCAHSPFLSHPELLADRLIAELT